jgi:hypothetical protein
MCKACNRFAAAVAEFRAVEAEIESKDRIQAILQGHRLAGKIAQKHGLPTNPQLWDNTGRDAAVRMVTAAAWMGQCTVESVLLGKSLHEEALALGWC